jgi:hypothetical protein
MMVMVVVMMVVVVVMAAVMSVVHRVVFGRIGDRRHLRHRQAG